MSRHQPTQTNAPAGNVANKCQGKTPGEAKSEAHTPPGGITMKAGELKKLLADVPDFYDVLFDFTDSDVFDEPVDITDVEIEPKDAQVILQKW